MGEKSRSEACDIWAWGSNERSQVGVVAEEGQDPQQCAAVFVPTHVRLTDTFSVVSVACGLQHTLALTRTGDVFAWGRNDLGQLGMSSKADCVLPRRIGEHVTCVAAGFTHSLVLTASKKVFAMGEGRFGRLGLRGLTDNQFSPVEIEALAGADVSRVFAGGNSSAAMTRQGDLFAWGWNADGQLGLGFVNEPLGGVLTPTEVGTRSLKAVVTAVDKRGAWPDFIARLRRLGDLLAASAGDALTRELMKKFVRTEYSQVEGQIKLIQDAVRAGGVTRESGRLLELATYVAQEIDAETPPEHKPALPEEREYAFAEISVGERHMVAVDAEGQLWAWGGNGHGQLGLPGAKNVLRPAKVELFKDRVRAVSAGSAHTAVVTADGALYTVGWCELGRLGYDISSIRDSAVLRRVENGLEGERVVCAACGEAHTVAVTDDGGLWTWGQNLHGQLGFVEAETDAMLPHPPCRMAHVRGASAAYAGNLHTVALLAGFSVLAQLVREGNVRALGLVAKSAQLWAVADADGATALHVAAAENRDAVVEFLAPMRAGWASMQTSRGDTPLHCAAAAGAEKSIRALAALRGVDVDCKNRDGRTPLHLAALNRHSEAMQVLVSCGADQHAKDAAGQTPSEILAQEGGATGSTDHIAVSYAPEDKVFAQQLARSLNKQGIRTWIDDGTGVDKARALLESMMGKKTREAAGFVWVISRHSLASARCKEELHYASKLGKKLFPVWYELILRMPPDVEQVVYLQQVADFTHSDYKENVLRLSHGIKNELGMGRGMGLKRKVERRGGKDLELPMDGIDPDFLAPPLDEAADKDRDKLPPPDQDEKERILFMWRAAQESKHYVFMSYHRDEEEIARRMSQHLWQHGYPCYLGSNRVHDDKVVSEMVLGCAAFVLLLSERSVKNPHVRQNLYLAENHNLLIFPVQISQRVMVDTPMQYTLARTPRFLATVDGIEQLVYAIRVGSCVREAEQACHAKEREIVLVKQRTSKRLDECTELARLLKR
eukprot:m51a1_g9830 hypothetical protein (1004) ;mRNA; r:1920609-1924455